MGEEIDEVFGLGQLVQVGRTPDATLEESGGRHPWLARRDGKAMGMHLSKFSIEHTKLLRSHQSCQDSIATRTQTIKGYDDDVLFGLFS